MRKKHSFVQQEIEHEAQEARTLIQQKKIKVKIHEQFTQKP